MRGGACSTIAILRALFFDLERVGKHTSGDVFSHDVLCGTLREADKLVDGCMMAVDDVEQLGGGSVGIGARGDGVLPTLGGIAGLLRA